MNRLLASGVLSDEERKLARERGEYNGNAARTALEELERHAWLTELGKKFSARFKPIGPALRAIKISAIPMADRVHEMLLTAIGAARHGVAPEPAVAEAIIAGDRTLAIEQLKFDSLAWMEFCISVELQSGQELTPAEIANMRYVSEIEEWLRARL